MVMVASLVCGCIDAMCVCSRPLVPSPHGRRYRQFWPTEPRLAAAVAGGDSGLRTHNSGDYMQKQEATPFINREWTRFGQKIGTCI
jgi:hypothetical protein